MSAPDERGAGGAAAGDEGIAPERRALLDGFAEELARHLRDEGRLQLLFVCTHNSRRSHMGQIWAHLAARHVGLRGVTTASGGTETTAFHPHAVAALRRVGLAVEAEGPGDNPVYLVHVAAAALPAAVADRDRRREGVAEPAAAAAVEHAADPPLRCWSKRYDDPANPQRGFVAVMLCTSADRACPSLPGAVLRVALPYDDPGAADGTADETATYDRCCAQIAREMLYLAERARAGLS